MEFDMNEEGETVFGIFESRRTLKKAIQELKENDFRRSDISVLMQANEETSKLLEENSLSWLSGARTITIPELGEFISAGPVMLAIEGAGMASGLMGMGTPEYEARRFEMLVKEGGLLIMIHTEDPQWSLTAHELLDTCGAKDIATVDTHVQEKQYIARDKDYGTDADRVTTRDV